jgi:hypothetical protein
MGGFSLKVWDDDERKRFNKIILREEIGSVLFPWYHTIKNNIGQFEENFERSIKTKKTSCYLLCNEEKDLGVACVLVLPHINRCVADIGSVPDGRGKDLKYATLDAMKMFFEEYPKYDMFTYVKANNRPSLIFSQQVGLKIFKRIRGDYVLRYKHHDG